MVFKKGNIPWNNGTHKSGMKGKKHTKEYKKRMSIIMKGNKNGLGKICSEDKKRKISLSEKGKFVSEKTKQKIRAKRALQWGDKCPAWKGGISFEPYGFEFNDQLKEQIRKRDDHRCQECFRHQNELKTRLCVHHIDFNKKNNNPSNLISLCPNCHSQTNFNRNEWTNYFNNTMDNRNIG